MFPGDVIQDRFQRSAETKVHYLAAGARGAVTLRNAGMSRPCCQHSPLSLGATALTCSSPPHERARKLYGLFLKPRVAFVKLNSPAK